MKPVSNKKSVITSFFSVFILVSLFTGCIRETPITLNKLGEHGDPDNQKFQAKSKPATSKDYKHQGVLSAYWYKTTVKVKGRGNIEIRKVRVGDYVWTMFPRYNNSGVLYTFGSAWKKVEAVFGGRTETIVTIDTKDGRVVSSTLESQIPTVYNEPVKGTKLVNRRLYWAPTYKTVSALKKYTKRYLITVDNRGDFSYGRDRIKAFAVRKGNWKVVGLKVQDNHNFQLGNGLLVHNDDNFTFSVDAVKGSIPGVGTVSYSLNDDGVLKASLSRDWGKKNLANLSTGARTSFDFKNDVACVGAFATVEAGKTWGAQATVEVGVCTGPNLSVEEAEAYVKTTAKAKLPGNASYAYSRTKTYNVAKLGEAAGDFFKTIANKDRGAGNPSKSTSSADNSGGGNNSGGGGNDNGGGGNNSSSGGSDEQSWRDKPAGNTGETQEEYADRDYHDY